MRKDNNKISSIAIHALIFCSILISTWGYSENLAQRICFVAGSFQTSTLVKVGSNLCAISD